MKEQLRTEAEKRNLVYAKNINNEYNITGLIDISKNPPKIYCFCTEEIAKEILDFHAQQSKERDMLHGILDFLTNENSKYSIMYGNQKDRFADDDREYTISEMIEIYKSTLTK